MKNIRHTLIVLLAVFSIAVFVLYIIAFIANLTVCTEDFFRNHIHKSILLGMCALGAVEAVLLILGERKKQYKRWRKQNRKNKSKTVKRS